MEARKHTRRRWIEVGACADHLPSLHPFFFHSLNSTKAMTLRWKMSLNKFSSVHRHCHENKLKKWVTGLLKRPTFPGGRRRIIDRRWTHAPHTTISLYLNRYGPSQNCSCSFLTRPCPFSKMKMKKKPKSVCVCWLMSAMKITLYRRGGMISYTHDGQQEEGYGDSDSWFGSCLLA